MAIISIIVAAVLVGADQLFKFLIVQNFNPGAAAGANPESIPVIPGFLNFTYLENRGAAMGILENQRWFFIVTTALLVIAIIVALFKYKHHNMLTYIACALLLGGGVGNFIDRAVNGYVVDYLHVSFFPWIFNFADCCVVVGTILVLVFIFLFASQEQKKKPGDDPTDKIKAGE